MTRAVEGLPTAPRCLVMGVVNVTPDSFSDGGAWFEPDEAVRHGRRLIAAGADLLDVGGESTRPGADRPSEVDELARVLPVVAGLAEGGASVTVDTMRARVAERAIAAGAAGVNDVSGGLADPEMLGLVASLQVPIVLMHWRGHSAQMQRRAVYTDVVAEVVAELDQRVAAARDAGIEDSRIAVDPGIGFAKTAEHSWALLHALPALQALGRPLLVGASRKAFLGRLLGEGEHAPRPVGQRDHATAATTTLAAAGGAWCVRVHEVAGSADAVRVASRWAQG